MLSNNNKKIYNGTNSSINFNFNNSGNKFLNSNSGKNLSTSNEQLFEDREVERYDADTYKQRYGDRWKRLASSVRDIVQSDGTVIREYVIEDPGMLEQLSEDDSDNSTAEETSYHRKFYNTSNNNEKNSNNCHYQEKSAGIANKSFTNLKFNDSVDSNEIQAVPSPDKQNANGKNYMPYETYQLPEKYANFQMMSNDYEISNSTKQIPAFTDESCLKRSYSKDSIINNVNELNNERKQYQNANKSNIPINSNDKSFQSYAYKNNYSNGRLNYEHQQHQHSLYNGAVNNSTTSFRKEEDSIAVEEEDKEVQSIHEQGK